MMLEGNAKTKFKQYCLQYFLDLHHPYCETATQTDLGDLDAALDIFDSILKAGVSTKQLRGLETQFYAAFEIYLTSPRTEIGDLCNAIDRLSSLIDPFLKKIALQFFPHKSIAKETPQGQRRVLLWKTSNFADILEALGIISATILYKDQDHFWRGQRPEKAILREGFKSRQKGSHESRIHTLEQIEAVTYCVLGQYIVICLHLLHDPSVTDAIQRLTEKTRILYLLRERSRTFPLTNTLLSPKEHLLLYKNRRSLAPESHEKKFLFLNYLTRRGPVGFWLKKEKVVALEWARQFWSTSPNEGIKKGALEYLLLHGESLPVASLIEAFPLYSEKVVLARHMRQSVTLRDPKLLLRLCYDKREEVALEAYRSLSKVISKIDFEIKRLGRSQSERKWRLLREAIKGIAKFTDLGKYRSFREVPDDGTRIAYLYCLGEVGTEEDAVLLQEFSTKSRVRPAICAACWYGISRIRSRLGQRGRLAKLLRTRNKVIFFAVADGLERSGVSSLAVLTRQASLGPEWTKKVSETFSRIVNKGDRQSLRDFLQSEGIENTTRDALLALCSIGKASDCVFVLRQIFQETKKIDLYNHVRIAESLASIAGQDTKKRLKQWVKSPEFWAYIERARRAKHNRLPLQEVDNQALVRRLVASCFLRLAGRVDVGLVRKLMSHNYGWIAEKAAQRFAEIGQEKDLDIIVDELLKRDDLEKADRVYPLEGLSLLDQKLYFS